MAINQAGSSEGAEVSLLRGEPGPPGPAGAVAASALFFEFDELSGATTFDDSSAVGSSAEIAGAGVSAGAAGHSGNAISFNGGALVVPDRNPVPQSPTVRVEAWIAPEGDLLGRHTLVNKLGAYHLDQVGDTVEFSITGKRTSCVATSGPVLRLGSYQSVAGWYDGHYAVVAFNGSIVGLATCDAGPIADNAGSEIHIGGSVAGGIASNGFIGSIDSLRISPLAGNLGMPQSLTFRLEERQVGDGGTFSNGEWRTRALNTTKHDPAGLASLNLSQVTLPPGRYECEAAGNAFRVERHRIRLRDVTNGTTLATGSSEFANDGDAVSTTSTLRTWFYLPQTTTIELQHRGQTSHAGNGFGVGSGFGGNNLYAWLECDWSR
jgi:hypothetical protein